MVSASSTQHSDSYMTIPTIPHENVAAVSCRLGFASAAMLAAVVLQRSELALPHLPGGPGIAEQLG